MKFAFSSNAFRKYSLEETISIVAGAGFRGIEIMADVPHAWPPDLKPSDRGRVLRALKDHQMEVSNINAFMMCAIQDFHHPSWIEKEREFRQLRIKHTIDCIYLAADLGAKTISTEPGGPIDLSSRKGADYDKDWKEALDLFVDGINQVIPHAKKAGVRVLVEPEPDLLIQRSEEFLQFIGEVDQDVVGMNFDVGHFYCVNEDPAGLIEKMWPYIGHFHLEDIAATREHVHLALGKGAIDLRRVLSSIKGKGYTGYVTVELYPYQEDPGDIARQTMVYLKEWESAIHD